MAVNIGINGFGRIGRLVFRAALAQGKLNVVAVNDLTDARTLAYLLKHDSVHGNIKEDVSVDGNSIVVSGKKIRVIAERDPAKLPWKEMNVQVVIESTGRFRDRDSMSKHIQAGAKKVILTAPGKGVDKNINMGINENEYDDSKHNLISNASCTTNSLSPVMKVITEKFGIEKAIMTTIHSYTNDQSILDFPNKDLRRARAAAVSIIPTSTGAAKAVGEVIPSIKGIFDGIAMRVPTPNVSISDLVVILKKDATAEEINNALEDAANSEMRGIIKVSREPLVSRDFNGSPYSGIVDAELTKVVGGNLAKICIWYDNEWGYSNRIVELTEYVISHSEL
jgi:glyceraldehyde 3-phosphate dehydrogenase